MDATNFNVTQFFMKVDQTIVIRIIIQNHYILNFYCCVNRKFIMSNNITNVRLRYNSENQSPNTMSL